MFISRGKTKSRTTPGPSFAIKTTYKWPSNPWVVSPNVSTPTGGTQITESDGNRWPPPKGGDLHDYGSEFYTRKTEVIPNQYPFTSVHIPMRLPDIPCPIDLEGRFMLANAFGKSGQDYADFSGGSGKKLVPDFPDLSSSRSALEVKGAIAIAACNPGNQVAASATALGELLQDVPKLPGIALWKARVKALETLAASGDEFLNVVFGIEPTIGDMETFYKGVHKVDKLINQFERDSGRVVRRSFAFPVERTETEDEMLYRSPLGCTAVDNVLYPLPSRCLPVYKTIRKRTVERAIWFSGAFTYYLPSWYETGSKEDRMRLTAILLGGQPDLNTLWNLAPWSWAVDWLVNAGTYVKNLQSLLNFGTVLRYGYVMEQVTVTDTYMAGDKVRDAYPGYEGIYKAPYPAVAPVTLRVTTKKRIQANPFGFGISWDGLSTTQQAIVAALGITRVVR